MNGLALCAGAGGLELGLGLALGDSYRCVCYVEGEAYVAGVLAARMQDGSLAPAPIWDDLRTFDGRPWRGRVDLVSAGFPCQPFSLAGARESTRDHRYLWDEVARVVAEVEPGLVFLENVPGLLTAEFVPGDVRTKGEVFGQVLADLASLGFVGAWGCVRAAEAGAPHRRNRVFILGALPHAIGLLSEREQRRRAGSCGSGEARAVGHGSHGALANATGGRRTNAGRELDTARWRNTDRSDQALADTDERRCEVERSERLLDGERPPHRHDAHGRRLWGCDPWANWEAEPDVGRVADGVANRVDRLRAIGNGVVPQQAALAFRALAAAIAEKYPD